LLHRRRTDQQVVRWNRDALGRLLSTELAGDFRCTVGDGVHRNMLLEFIDERTASLPDLRRVGTCHAMNELGKGNC
jgi:YD repeat-containing protein